MATLQEIVNTAYLNALGRPADPAGLTYYTQQLEQGARIGDILADLEYAAATGAEDKAANQAVTAAGGWDFAPPPVVEQPVVEQQPVAVAPLTAQDLYNQFLGGRQALPADLKFWNDYITQYGPDQAMAAFDAASQQERNAPLEERAASLREQELLGPTTLTAQDLYGEFLGGRSALPADLDYWNNYIAVYGPEQARAAFDAAAQPEKEMPVEKRVESLREQGLTVPGSLLGEFATQRKATPNEVRAMYLSVLGREPDPAGFAYYTSQPIENLRQNFYQGSIPEMQERVAAIPVSTKIPKPLMGTTPPGAANVSVEIPGQTVTTDQGAPKPLTVDISKMAPEQQALTNLIAARMPRASAPAAGPVFTPGEVSAQLELERLKAMNAPATPAETPVAGFAQGGMVGNDINQLLRNQQSAIQRESQSRQMLNTLGAPPVKKFSDGGPAGSSSSGVRRLKMSGYQGGGDVSSNRFAQMMEDDQRAQDQFVGDMNRQLSELITRYRSGDQGVTEKDLLPFFPGYSEYDIAQMYGMTTEAANPRMSEKINPFTVDMIPGIKGRGEAVQRDYDRMVREKRLLDPMMPKKIMTLSDGGDVSNDAFIQEMMTGTLPTDQGPSPVDTAVSDFISSRSKLVTDPQEFFRVMGENLETYHGKPLREDPEKYLMEQLGPGALAGTVGKTAKQLFSSIPSSEAPFVGRMDEFVSSLPGAVQKDQFLNQLKGKFRDYDIGRAEEALADLPGNAKLTPFELLNRVKRVYDPTTFTTRIEPPKSETDYYARMDNPFKTEERFSQKPMGVIHLLQGANPATVPDAAKLMAAYDDIRSRLPETNSYSFDKTDRNPVSLAQDIYKIASRAGLSSVEDLGMDVQAVLQNMAKSGSDWNKLVSLKHKLGRPDRYRPEEIKEALEETARITGTLPEENIKSLQKFAEDIDARRKANQDYSDLESQYHSAFPSEFVDDLETANKRLWNEHRAGKKQIENLLEGLQKREELGSGVYRGQHSSLAEEPGAIKDPISFSRFTEHTTDIPGLGKVDGIYVHELQSDRLDDIRKRGRRGGGPQEDITKLDKLDKQIGEAAKQLADYKAAMGFRFMNEGDKTKISDFNSKLEGLNKRRNTLLERLQEGDYSLKESFAGMEESPQVIQQLMAKNAVAGAMQLGKRFVAFPGAESAQSQLYKKLPNNLKQVVKDLGPGFELRPITLPKPSEDFGGEGGELTSYAIVWGDEAAKRVQKQGVPFKDGGEVSTQDFIKRFSKGGAAEDDSWKDEIIRQANLKYSGMGPEDVSRMQEESLKKRMGEEIKGVEIPSLFKEFFPNYRVVKDLKEAGNAQVFDAMPDVVFADPELVKTNPLVLPHEFEHSMEGKARKRYAHSSFKEGAEKPNLPLPGKPEYFLEPGGKLKVSEITKKLGGGPEYFMEQSLMARGMNYEEAGDYLKNLKSSLGDVRLGDYLRNKYPDLDFRRLGNPDKKTPLAEYLADLSGIETLKGIDLTKDRFIKNFVFGGDDDLVAEYKAVTGIRQDRLDAKDLAPYVPDYDQSMASKVKRFIQEKLR